MPSDRHSAALRGSVGALGECAACVTRGLRDSLRPKLLLLSAGILLLSVVLWLAVFIGFRDTLFDLCLRAADASVDFVQGVWSSAGRASAPAGSFWDALDPRRPLAWILFAAAYIGLVIATINIALELFLMERIKPLVLAQYPELEGERPAPLRHKLRNAVGPALTFVLCGGVLLPIPVLNGIGLYLLACYLLVRGTLTDALEEVADPAETRAVLRASRGRMLLLGLLLTLILLVPLLGLAAPGLTAAATAHLGFRQLSRLRAAGRV